jgi:hypothetical protein
VTSQQCHVLYDLKYEGVLLWPALLGIGVIGLGLCLVLFLRQASFGKRWGVLIFGIVWTAVGCINVWRYYSLETAVSKHEYERVEGLITEYHALEARQHGMESFVVNGQPFKFSDGDLAPGFKLSRRRGSPLGVGTFVSVTLIDRTIVRLEICRPNG